MIQERRDPIILWLSLTLSGIPDLSLRNRRGKSTEPSLIKAPIEIENAYLITEIIIKRSSVQLQEPNCEIPVNGYPSTIIKYFPQTLEKALSKFIYIL
jgi:hypothetical protein